MNNQKSSHGFALALLRWFAENGRELPWRGTRDPYAIWLSEIILQQTRVQQGWTYWERFMRRWPTVGLLAAATEDEVLRQWQGLGYYSRARNLHFAARQIVEMGGFPQTLEGIRSLKGVGDYTAAAIGSMAFDLPVAVVDGNVYRVLARHFGIATPINSTEGKKEFAALAQELLPEGEAAAYNQAIMDFGAIQCTPQSPRCLLCPLQESCVALREGRIAELPVKLKTIKVKERHLTYVYVRYKGETAIRRRGEGDIWQGLWEPLRSSLNSLTPDSLTHRSLTHRSLTPDPSPRGEGSICLQAQTQMAKVTTPLSPARGVGGEASVGEASVGEAAVGEAFEAARLIQKNFRHVLTHQVLLCDFYLWEPSARPALPDGYIWIKEEELEHYALPRMIELLIGLLP